MTIAGHVIGGGAVGGAPAKAGGGSSINIRVPVPGLWDKVANLGVPFHGSFRAANNYRGNPGVLTLPNAATMAWGDMNGTGTTPEVDCTTFLTKCPQLTGALPAYSPSAADVTAGRTWPAYALSAGAAQQTAGKLLSSQVSGVCQEPLRTWIYFDDADQPWLIKAALVHNGGNLTLTRTVRRFGLLDGKDHPPSASRSTTAAGNGNANAHAYPWQMAAKNSRGNKVIFNDSIYQTAVRSAYFGFYSQTWGNFYVELTVSGTGSETAANDCGLTFSLRWMSELYGSYTYNRGADIYDRYISYHPLGYSASDVLSVVKNERGSIWPSGASIGTAFGTISQDGTTIATIGADPGPPSGSATGAMTSVFPGGMGGYGGIGYGLVRLAQNVYGVLRQGMVGGAVGTGYLSSGYSNDVEIRHLLTPSGASAASQAVALSDACITAGGGLASVIASNTGNYATGRFASWHPVTGALLNDTVPVCWI